MQASRLPRAYVTVLRTRRNAFVEFAFALGDPELAVELVLPFAAFDELCARYDVHFLERTQ